MGWLFGSSEETEINEENNIDPKGQVDTNIIIQEARDTHNQLIANAKLLIATYLLVAIESIKLFTYLFLQFKKNLKKKYQAKPKTTE